MKQNNTLPKKISDIKPGSPQSKNQYLNHKTSTVTNKQKNSQDYLLEIKNTTQGSDIEKNKIPIRKIFSIIIGTIFLLGFLVLISSLSYHAIITITPKTQDLPVNQSILATPIHVTNNLQSSLPYYVAVLDDQNVVSDYTFHQLQLKLPPDVITNKELMFLTRETPARVGIIFFKYSDIKQYFTNHLIDTTYKNHIVQFINFQVIPKNPITEMSLGENIIVNFSGNIISQGIWDVRSISQQVAGMNKQTCKEVLEYIPEIKLDGCRIIPFWYNKIPGNSKFIRIIVK